MKKALKIVAGILFFGAMTVFITRFHPAGTPLDGWVMLNFTAIMMAIFLSALSVVFAHRNDKASEAYTNAWVGALIMLLITIGCAILTAYFWQPGL